MFPFVVTVSYISPVSVSHQENQALRAGGREEAQGPDDPVLDDSTCSKLPGSR